MKIHATNTDTALCGSLSQRPDTFVYSIKQFNEHYSEVDKCKKCKAIINKTPTFTNSEQEVINAIKGIKRLPYRGATD